MVHNHGRRLDGFQLHRAAVAYASVSDGPSPRLAGGGLHSLGRIEKRRWKTTKLKVSKVKAGQTSNYTTSTVNVILCAPRAPSELVLVRHHDHHHHYHQLISSLAHQLIISSHHHIVWLQSQSTAEGGAGEGGEWHQLVDWRCQAMTPQHDGGSLVKD